jgi:hypothetical protein
LCVRSVGLLMNPKEMCVPVPVLAAFVLTKILTKTARLPPAVSDARALCERGHLSLCSGLLRFLPVDSGGR